MHFKKLDTHGIKIIQAIITKKSYGNSFYTNGVLFAWKDYFKIEYALITEETVLMRGQSDVGNQVYFFPLGRDLDEALKQIPNQAEIIYIPENYIHLFSQVQEMPNEFDYVYEKSHYSSLTGKDKAAMRNHINSFKKHYPNYSYRPITNGNLKAAQFFLDSLSFEDKFKKIEKNINREVLPHLETYHLFGYMLYVQDVPVALAVAELLHDTIYIHFEKNDHDYLGSGDMNRHCFIESVQELSFIYFNREEDVGDIGLRTSKMRQKPNKLILKYKALNQ